MTMKKRTIMLNLIDPGFHTADDLSYTQFKRRILIEIFILGYLKLFEIFLNELACFVGNL